MKLFRKRKKNNRGFSLVEMICAIAILSLTSTAIGSVMIMSTKNYQRGNAEVDVQKEAQITTNLIGNLLVDAVDANYDPSTKTLTINGEGITYLVVYDAANQKLTYKETALGGATFDGVLAENVSDFDVDLSKFLTNKNAKVDLAIDKDGKSYDASYNTTARNGRAFNVGAVESAVIVCETEVVLEPGQTYHLDARVYGNPTDDGLDWSGMVPASPGAAVGHAELRNVSDTGADIYVAPDTKGTLTFVISTDETDGSGVVLDTKTVTVRVRRANTITPAEVLSGTGVQYKAGTQYKIYADVACDNPDMVIGKAWDNDYIDPRHVDFQVVDEGSPSYTITSVWENETRPFVVIDLTADMPAGSKITINMRSKHAAGDFSGNVENKEATAYDSSVIATHVIENAQGAVWLDSGIMRGNDNMLFNSTLQLDKIKDFGGEPRWYYRYREKGSTDNSWRYHRTLENGYAKKFNANETRLWLPDLGYEIEMICMSFSTNGGNIMMEYPQDPTLLAELQAQWPGLNIQQGWVPDDLNSSFAATTFLQYGGKLQIDETKIWYDYAGSYQEQYGNHNHPLIIHKNSGEIDIDWNTSNLTRGHYGFSHKVYMYNSATSKYDIDVTSTIGTNGINIEFDNGKFKFNNFKLNDAGTGSKTPGKYVFVPWVVGNYYNNGSSASLLNGYHMVDQGNSSWKLGDELTGKGCLFFELQ